MNFFDRSEYMKRRYRKLKYGDPDYVIPRKNPVSLAKCETDEEKRRRRNAYMKARYRILKYGDANIPLRRGRPPKKNNDDSDN